MIRSDLGRVLGAKKQAYPWPKPRKPRRKLDSHWTGVHLFSTSTIDENRVWQHLLSGRTERPFSRGQRGQGVARAGAGRRPLLGLGWISHQESHNDRES